MMQPFLNMWEWIAVFHPWENNTAKCLSYLSVPICQRIFPSYTLLALYQELCYLRFHWADIFSFLLPVWLVLPLIFRESLWINNKHQFLPCQECEKAPCSTSSPFTFTPHYLPHLFSSCISVTNRMYCKENRFCFFLFPNFLAITNHRAYSLLEIVFPWIQAHSILHPIFNSPHSFLHASFFYSLLSNKVPWNSLHKVGRRHEDRDGAYDVEKAERHQTKTVDYGTCKFPLVGHAFGLILLPETVCHVAYLLQDSL